MIGWNFALNIIFICLISGYLLVERVDSIFPKTQPVYTDSFLPAAIQVTQHLIDKIYEIVENPPDVVTEVPAVSTETDTSPATLTVSPTSPTTTHESTTAVNIPLTTTNAPPTTANISITTNVSPVTTDVLPKITNSSSIVSASDLATLTTEMSSLFVLMEQTFQSQNTEYQLETATKSESISVSVASEQINSQYTDYCPLTASLISEHPTIISDATPNREYTVLNGTENEDFIESVLKQNSTDKVHIIASSSSHKNESGQYTIATLVLTRLRDILAVEAKHQGMSRIQGYSTELLELLASTSKMSSSDQLSFILKNMLKNTNAKRRESIAQSRIVLESLSTTHSSLSTVLTHIPAFQYT